MTSTGSVPRAPHCSTAVRNLLQPKTSQNIVLGFGSTAFPRLLAQQSANARIEVALGKLPWGFADVAGGPSTLDAWEAVVWGDKSYCVFVLVAPLGTAWSGVAGFIKSIFRWNAPPAQSIDIGSIAASAAVNPTRSSTVVTYTGMMGAATQFNAAHLLEDEFIAGELALITATTNNQSIWVDFSGWVRDKSNHGQILANVASSNPPRYAEAAYSAYRKSDGTPGISISPLVVAAPLISASDKPRRQLRSVPLRPGTQARSDAVPGRGLPQRELRRADPLG